MANKIFAGRYWLLTFGTSKCKDKGTALDLVKWDAIDGWKMLLGALRWC